MSKLSPPVRLAAGVVRQEQMLRAGLILNLLAIPVVWIMVSWLAR